MVDDLKTHKSLYKNESPQSSSNLVFGLIFAVFFSLIGIWPLLWDGDIRWWALTISATFLLTALIIPKSLSFLNQSWMKFGLLMHRFVNPLIMGLIFFVAVTPTALIIRVLGKDPLRRHLERDAKTYWIDRTPPGPEAKSMRHQF